MSSELDPELTTNREAIIEITFAEALHNLEDDAFSNLAPKAYRTAKQIAVDQQTKTIMGEYLAGDEDNRGKCIAFANIIYHFNKQQNAQAGDDLKARQLAISMGIGLDTVIYSIVFCKELQGALGSLPIREFIDLLPTGVKLAENAEKRNDYAAVKLSGRPVLQQLLPAAGAAALRDIKSRQEPPMFPEDTSPKWLISAEDEINAHRFGHLVGLSILGLYLDSTPKSDK